MKLVLERAVLAVIRGALCYVIASTGSFQNAFHPHALNLFLKARTALFIESCGSSSQIICKACFICSLFAGLGESCWYLCSTRNVLVQGVKIWRVRRLFVLTDEVRTVLRNPFLYLPWRVAGAPSCWNMD